MIDILQKSSLIKVQFEVALPETATREEILEWVSHSLNSGGISTSNPLLRHSIDPVQEPLLSETDSYLHREIVPNEDGTIAIRSRRLPWADSEFKSAADMIHEQHTITERKKRGAL